MHLNKDFSILATRLANFSEEDKAELRNILLAKKSPARYQIITSPLEFTKTFISNSLEKFRDTIRQRLTTALNISDATVFAVYDAIVQFELSVFVLLSNLHSCYLTILMSTQPVFFSVTNALAYCRFTHEYLTPHIVKKCSKRVLGGDANYVMIVSRDSYNDCLAFFGLPADNYSPVIVKRAIQFGKRVEDFIFEPLYIMYAYICYIRETPARLSEKFHARYFLINPRNEINAIRDLERQTGVKVTYV